MKKFKDLNKKWGEKLHTMYDTKERLMDDKRNELLDQIRKKNEKTSKILDKSKHDREMRWMKMSKTMKDENQIQILMKEHLESLEQKRIEIDQMIQKKCEPSNFFTFIINFSLLMLIIRLLKPAYYSLFGLIGLVKLYLLIEFFFQYCRDVIIVVFDIIIDVFEYQIL